MSTSDFPVAQDLLAQMWAGLGGDPNVPDRVSFTGEGNLPSPFPLSDLAGAAFGVAGAAVSELLATAGAAAPRIEVDRVLAGGWFYLPAGPSQRLGGETPRHSAADFPFFTELPTADDRWLRMHGIFPSSRARIARALGVDEDIDQVAAIVRESKADEIEQHLVDAGCIVGASRTPEEWLAHPAGAAVDAEPLAAITDFAAGGSSWQPTLARPLSGIRVLDLTRVVAGPFGTRFLAALGAEVLRIDAPDSEESQGTIGKGAEQIVGKRWALLDLKTPEGLKRFKQLLARADVLVHGYRPGGIDSLISEEERRAIKPDLVEVALRAYGWEGPWRMRRGFDTIVQFSTGLANATQTWALEDPEHRLPLKVNSSLVDATRPRHTMVEGLDCSTGYQIAAAVIRGLTKRLQSGTGSLTKYSLARTASMVIRARGTAEPGPVLDLPLEGPWEDRVYGGPFGPVRRLVFPIQIERTPLFWERPAEPAGSSAPRWAS